MPKACRRTYHINSIFAIANTDVTSAKKEVKEMEKYADSRAGLRLASAEKMFRAWTTIVLGTGGLLFFITSLFVFKPGELQMIFAWLFGLELISVFFVAVFWQRGSLLEAGVPMVELAGAGPMGFVMLLDLYGVTGQWLFGLFLLLMPLFKVVILVIGMESRFGPPNPAHVLCRAPLITSRDIPELWLVNVRGKRAVVIALVVLFGCLAMPVLWFQRLGILSFSGQGFTTLMGLICWSAWMLGVVGINAYCLFARPRFLGATSSGLIMPRGMGQREAHLITWDEFIQTDKKKTLFFEPLFFKRKNADGNDTGVVLGVRKELAALVMDIAEAGSAGDDIVASDWGVEELERNKLSIPVRLFPLMDWQMSSNRENTAKFAFMLAPVLVLMLLFNMLVPGISGILATASLAGLYFLAILIITQETRVHELFLPDTRQNERALLSLLRGVIKANELDLEETSVGEHHVIRILGGFGLVKHARFALTHAGPYMRLTMTRGKKGNKYLNSTLREQLLKGLERNGMLPSEVCLLG